MEAKKPDTPSLTIRTMTDYLTASGAHQRFTVLQNSKSQLGRRGFAPYYRSAREAIRHETAGSANSIRSEVQRLLRERREAVRPMDIARIENNLRVLRDYRNHFSEVEVMHQSRRFQPLVVEGVRVSTEPTLSGTILVGRSTIPCNIIVDCQSEEPEGREVDYALELLYRGSGLTHQAPLRGVQYWHASSGGTWSLARSSARRWRDIEEACREVALRWPTIKPLGGR